MKNIFNQLAQLGVGEFKHYNGSLASHLENTHAILSDWESSEKVCKAGLFHAVYGTAGYAEQVCDLSQRQQVQALIGADVEELVYLYCACDRQQYYPRIGTDSQYVFINRFTETQESISHETLCELCELIMANELEIANHDTSESKAFVAKWGEALCELFNRMENLVSKKAFLTYQRILRNKVNTQG